MLSNPNLLINTYYKKGYLVNQRGQSIYRQPWDYIVDMLFCCVVGEDTSKSEVIVTDIGLQYHLNGASYFHNFWRTENEIMRGKIITLSVEVDHIVYTLTCDFIQEPFAGLIYNEVLKRYEVQIVFHKDHLLGGLKLEEGTVSTYGRNVPDYAETLRKCQYYYYQSWPGSIEDIATNIDAMINYSVRGFVTDYNFIVAELPVAMRNKRTVAVYDLEGREGKVSKANWDGARTSMDVQIYRTVGNGIGLVDPSGTMQKGDMCLLLLKISAEL